jgi:3',5'-nucleoside bisphosphate phosphatase
VIVRADLHIHTVLSPCAAPEMTPAAVVQTARARGLRLLAVCDHNAAANAGAAQRAAEPPLRVLAGIEITTAEEVHLLGVFPDAAAATAVADVVRRTLPPRNGGPAWMGPQRIVDEHDRTIGHEDRMLAAASGLTLAAAVDLVHAHGGLAVAAHVDRPSFSLISQLGLVPPGLPLDALEVSPAGRMAGKHVALEAAGLPLVCGSDAHSLDEIGDGETTLELAEVGFEPLRRALAAAGGGWVHA